jgi:hypothetical protein
MGNKDTKSTSVTERLARLLYIVGTVAWACMSMVVLSAAQQSGAKGVPPVTTVPVDARSFDTPEQAVGALIDAAEKFDVDELVQIFGPDGEDIVLSGEYPQDRQRAFDFAAEAHEKKSVSVDPKSGNRAFLLIGNETWPFPVPIVRRGDRWSFDARAGRQELFYRRIGSNELGCH